MAAPEQPLPAARGCPSSASQSPPRGDRTLLVRHLPAELTAEEKEDLLKYFGAQSVRVLSDKGRLVRAPRGAMWADAWIADGAAGKGVGGRGWRTERGWAMVRSPSRGPETPRKMGVPLPRRTQKDTGSLISQCTSREEKLQQEVGVSELQDF